MILSPPHLSYLLVLQTIQLPIKNDKETTV